MNIEAIKAEAKRIQVVHIEAIKQRLMRIAPVAPIGSDLLHLCGDLFGMVTEVERLRRIEAAARDHIAAWDGGDTFAHDTRAALRDALQEE